MLSGFIIRNQRLQTRAVPMLTYFFHVRPYANVNVPLRAVRRDNLWAFGTKRKRTVHSL
jgi:hypothetical protein